MTVSRDISRKIADTAGRFKEEKSFWLTQFTDDWKKSRFPFSSKPATPGSQDQDTANRDIYDFDIRGELFKQLSRISRDNNYTLHVLLLAALAVLLKKYGNGNDIVQGTPIYKQEKDARFVNTVLPLRTPVQGNDTFKGVLIKVKESLTRADKHQNYPMETLAKDLRLTAPQDVFPFFDVALLLENIHDIAYISHTSPSLTFSFHNRDENLEGKVHYDPSGYDESTLQGIVGHYINLLEQGTQNPNIGIEDIDILTEQEKRQFIHEYNDTASVSPTPWEGIDMPGGPTIHGLFELQAEKKPGNTALYMGDRTISYAGLNQAANRLAHQLISSGINPGAIVTIMAERSVEMVIGILGILKAGCAYLPLSPTLPPSRKQFIMEDCLAGWILLDRLLLDENRDLLKSIPPGQAILLDDYATGPKDEDEDTSPLPDPKGRAGSGDLGYIIYTSGSTGRPKGVMLEHSGIVNYINWAAHRYVGDENLDFPLYTSFAFDLTVTSIFTPLVTGNAIDLYPEDENDLLIYDVMNQDRVGVVKLTPSHMKLLREHWSFTDGTDSARKLPFHIKRLIVGGEALDTRLADDIYRHFNGNIEIYNEYGPTETVVGSMIHLYAPGNNTGDAVPIGKPIHNTQVYLLDNDKNPVPTGVTGEIFIAGHGVARGYLNRPELTAEKFIENPFSPGERLYATGDLGRRLPDGNLEFLGRIDHQVKIRGYRVELGEIENQLREYRRHDSVLNSDAGEKLDYLKSVPRCRKCLLPEHFPASNFDDTGVCGVCREYEEYQDEVARYFQDIDAFDRILKNTRRSENEYDCLLLFSGGKDSTYVLYRLIDMGLKVLTFTFDNGYISDAAFANIKATTEGLGVKNIVCRAEHMNRVFIESLNVNSNVCHGCWNALNTMGAKIAHQHGTNLVISGLSRGQIFEMRLHGLFQRGIFDHDKIEENLLLFRKAFHSKNNMFSRLLDLELPEEVVEHIQFVDFFRYEDTPVPQIRQYLKEKGWIQPSDTGFCSSNCIINDVGIYVHLKEEGYHFYTAPLSWDVRLGIISREQGLKEIGFEGDVNQVDQILKEIGYYHPPIRDAVVIDREDLSGGRQLVAYYVSGEELTVPDMRGYLAAKLPDYMVPAHFVRLDEIPLASSGKVNRDALPEPKVQAGGNYVPPENDVEEKMTAIWAELLGFEKEIISTEINFFDLGGHSLGATLMVGKIHEVFDKIIPLGEIFKNPTVKGISSLISVMDWVKDKDKPAGNKKKEEIIL